MYDQYSRAGYDNTHAVVEFNSVSVFTVHEGCYSLGLLRTLNILRDFRIFLQTETNFEFIQSTVPIDRIISVKNARA